MEKLFCRSCYTVLPNVNAIYSSTYIPLVHGRTKHYVVEKVIYLKVLYTSPVTCLEKNNYNK